MTRTTASTSRCIERSHNYIFYQNNFISRVWLWIIPLARSASSAALVTQSNSMFIVLFFIKKFIKIAFYRFLKTLYFLWYMIITTAISDTNGNLLSFPLFNSSSQYIKRIMLMHKYNKATSGKAQCCKTI